MSRLSGRPEPVQTRLMETKMTQTARQALMAASQRLDSDEQVSRFLAHSRMVVAAYQASRKLAMRVRRR